MTLHISSLEELGIIKLTGQDSIKFAQGQFSCDIQDVTEQQSRLGCHCTPQGRIIAIFRILRWQDGYLLILPRSLVSNFLQHLKKYAVFFKCSLTECTSEFVLTGLIGEIDSSVKLPEKKDEVAAQERCLVIKHSDLPQYLVVCESTPTFEGTSSPFSLWHLTCIRAGIAWVYPKTQDLFLPHRLNLHILNAISFTKGCYTGQEVIARTHYLGKLKYHMYLIEVETDLDICPGLEVMDTVSAQGVGHIVDACKNENGAYECLAILPNNLAEHENLRIGSVNGVRFKPLSLPYSLENQ